MWALLCLPMAAPVPPTDSIDSERHYIDSVQAKLHYQTGRITLPDDLSVLTVPAGFRYLDAKQSAYVLTKL